MLDKSRSELRQQISQGTGSGELWRGVVSKEIDDKFLVIAAVFSTVQKSSEEMRKKSGSKRKATLLYIMYLTVWSIIIMNE